LSLRARGLDPRHSHRQLGGLRTDLHDHGVDLQVRLSQYGQWVASAVEYSVINQDDFGKRFLIKLNVILVIMGLIQNPIFGGS
jgi:hypothetical protein